MAQSQINIRVDKKLKEKSYEILKSHGVIPSEFLTDMLEYVVKTGKLPIKKVLLSEEDLELLEAAKNKDSL